MLDILTASPSVGAWKHQPMTVSEVDAHPDADRIWATIAAIQGEYQRGYDDALETVDEDEIAEKAADDALNDAKSDVERVIRNLGDKISLEAADAILGALE